MTIKGKAYIAGIYEHPTRHAPDKSTAQLHAEVAKGAIEDAGLTKNDIDGYFMVSDLSGDQTGKVLGVSGPRGVREMRMMEMEGWTPPFTGWKAEDIVTHAKEIFFSEEEIKKSARRFK